MRESEGPFGDESIETESRRLTPSTGLDPADSSNEDFLFHLYRGSELLQDNRVHEAKEELERALHLQPRDSKGQDLLGVVYFRLGLHTRAIQIYEQLRRRNANDTALLLNLALCYLKTGQPQAARRDLEQLLSLNPTHARAWGYLGLACERLGDVAAAERAFQQGGHGQMAKRLAARRDAAGAGGAEEPEQSQAIRAVAGAAYRELDAGELTFALADPTNERDVTDAASESWQSHEPGQIRLPEPANANANANAKPSVDPPPDTRDGARLAGQDATVIPAIPHLGHIQHHLQHPHTHTHTPNRRPTLIAPVGAPPAHELTASEFSTVARIPSNQPPSFALDDAAASLRRPVVSVPSPYGSLVTSIPGAPREVSKRGTLAPPHGAPSRAREDAAADPAPVGETQSPQTPLGMGPEHTTASSIGVSHPASVRFPDTSGVVLHRSGLALVQTTDEVGFAARLESIRAQQSGLKMALLERHVKGKANGESFGGVASPMVLTAGAGQLVLAPRAGRKLYLFAIDADMCFAREDVLLGFGASLAFENGRLATGDGESVPFVQLKGSGGVLLEAQALGEVLTLPVHSPRGLSVRREVVLGWFGRLVPRALPPSDASCGQRGLVNFAGEGRVLITSV